MFTLQLNNSIKIKSENFEFIPSRLPLLAVQMCKCFFATFFEPFAEYVWGNLPPPWRILKSFVNVYLPVLRKAIHMCDCMLISCFDFVFHKVKSNNNDSLKNSQTGLWQKSLDQPSCLFKTSLIEVGKNRLYFPRIQN